MTHSAYTGSRFSSGGSRRSPLLLQALLALPLLGGVSAISAFAESEEAAARGTRDLYSKPLDEILNTEVLTVGKSEESLKRTPARVTIYTREDLNRLKPRNLADLLELTSGFLIGRDTDDVSLGSRGVVTDNNQKFMIAIDGHRITNNNNFGVNPFHETRNLIEIAERIEIVRGTGGELWGPDAFLGLINIITRKPQADELSTQANLTYGFDDTKAAGISYLEEVKEGVNVSFYLDTLSSNGEKVSTELAGQGGADTRNGGYYERYDEPTLSLNARMEAGSAWLAGQAVNVISSVENSPQEEEFSQIYVEAGRKFLLHRTTALSVRAYGDRFHHERRSSASGGGEIYSSTPENRLGAEVVASTRWAEMFRTVLGWDTRYYRYTGGSVGQLFPEAIGDDMGILQPLPPFPNNASAIGDYTWNGFFAEGVLDGGIWDFHAGGRVDVFSDRSEDLFAPRLALGLYPSEEFTLKAIYSEGALRPSWTQLSGFFSFDGQGRPDLDSEESRSFELLADWATNNSLSSLSVYYAQYDDTISFVNTVQGAGYENYADYRTIGLEWDNRVKVARLLDAFLNFTWYIDVERDEDVSLLQGISLFGIEGQQVRPGTDDPFNIPDYFFTTGVSLYLPIADKQLVVTPIVRYIGPHFVQPRDGLPVEKLDSAYLDLKAGIDLTEDFNISLIAKNILDDQDRIGIARGIPGIVKPKGSTYEIRASYRF